ncbi:MAG: Lrp/AsnC family transcriptional regulator, partial [Actinobacteria bacterium ATB1]|nr:Lrp/AsnC family transcriptional regulator [Actinobacteria bacterium ATB1]
DGDLRELAGMVAKLDEVDYVVICAGGFDLIAEVVCEDPEHLLHLVNDVIRSMSGVRNAQAFTYLHLEKQSYSWGTR